MVSGMRSAVSTRNTGGLFGRVLLALFLVTLSACSPARATSGSSPLWQVVDGGAGTIFGYSNLNDKVLDSDAVVVGRFVDVVPAGSEDTNDGSGAPIDYIDLVVEVDQVLHTAPGVSIQPGDELRIETIWPPLLSLDAIRQSAVGAPAGVHFLFNSARLVARIKDPTADSDPDVWLYQDASPLALADAGASPEMISFTPSSLRGMDLAGMIDTIRGIDRDLTDRGLEQPETPIGLAPRSTTG